MGSKALNIKNMAFDKKGGKKKKKAPKPQVKRTSPQKYVKEVRLELKKVAWPSRPEVVLSTVVVIIAVIIFGAYTGLLDLFFQYLLKLSTGLK